MSAYTDLVEKLQEQTWFGPDDFDALVAVIKEQDQRIAELEKDAALDLQETARLDQRIAELEKEALE
jgi:hypothetical protein